jgi:hypothetical protein
MVQRLKAVPEALYRKLWSIYMNQDNASEKIEQEKKTVLGQGEIGDDVKLMLFQALNRQAINKKNEEDGKPLLVQQVPAANPPLHPAAAAAAPVGAASDIPHSHALDPKLKMKFLLGCARRGEDILQFLMDTGLRVTDTMAMIDDKEFSHGALNGIMENLSNGIRKDPSSNLVSVLNFLKEKNVDPSLFPKSIQKHVRQQKGEGFPFTTKRIKKKIVKGAGFPFTTKRIKKKNVKGAGFPFTTKRIKKKNVKMIKKKFNVRRWIKF